MTIHMPKINTSNNEGGGGGEVKEVALLSITTAPTGEFAKGSKYYNSTDKKIYTAVVADSWDGATTDDPQFGTYYIYDDSTYVWDGDSLEKYNLEDFIPKTDIVNNLNTDDATKVLSAEQGKVLNDIIATKQPILEVDNIINENSYNVVSNKGIAEGIKAKTTNVVDDVVDVLPTADTLDKKVLLTTDNKIYKTVKEKVINSAFIVTGNLTTDSKGNISGFSDTNYLTLTSQYWIQFFPIKIGVVFSIDTNDVPFLQIYRNDNNSLLFSLSLRDYSSGSQFSAKVYDNGNVIETQSFVYDKAISNTSGVFEIKMTMNRIDISKEGTFITSLFLSKLNISLIPYNVAGTVKLSNIISGGYSNGIYYIDGLNSSVYQGSYTKIEHKLAVDKSGNNFVWQEELTCQKGSKIINQKNNNLFYYDGTQWYIVGENVFIDVENSLPITNIDTKKIYRLHKTKWKYNNIVYDNITQYCTNLPVSSTGIILDGENETAWTDLTDADITNAGDNIWVKTNLDNSWQFGKYDTDSYDYYTSFTKKDVYELYFNPKNTADSFIGIELKTDANIINEALSADTFYFRPQGYTGMFNTYVVEHRLVNAKMIDPITNSTIWGTLTIDVYSSGNNIFFTQKFTKLEIDNTAQRIEFYRKGYASNVPATGNFTVTWQTWVPLEYPAISPTKASGVDGDITLGVASGILTVHCNGLILTSDSMDFASFPTELGNVIKPTITNSKIYYAFLNSASADAPSVIFSIASTGVLHVYNAVNVGSNAYFGTGSVPLGY